MKESAVIKQIVDKKARSLTGQKRTEAVVDKLMLIQQVENFNDYLFDLLHHNKNAYELIDSYDAFASYGADHIIQEQLKYSPVAAVACMEVYTRSVYAFLIDYGSPFLERAKKIISKNIPLDDFIGMQKHSLTLGDYASHSISASNFENITKNLGMLLDVDFPKTLRVKHEENIKENQFNLIEVATLDEEGLKSRMNERTREKAVNFIKALKEIISIRHLICHENTYDVKLETVYRQYGSPSVCIQYFILLTEEIINDVLDKE